MSGRRSLTEEEERRFLRAVRRLSPRNRALVTAQWQTGFRIREILSLTIGSVIRDGQVRPQIAIAPRHLKGGYGRTRYIPVLPELHGALERYHDWLQRRRDISTALPLFLSREHEADGSARPLSCESARRIIHKAFALAGIVDDGRLGTHTLRKTWARNVYVNSGNDLLVVRAALGHSDVSVTQHYLEPDEAAVLSAIRRCDFTRTRRLQRSGATFPFPLAEAKSSAA